MRQKHAFLIRERVFFHGRDAIIAYLILFSNEKQTLFIGKAPLNASPICAKAQMPSHADSDALSRYEKQTLSTFHRSLV